MDQKSKRCTEDRFKIIEKKIADNLKKISSETARDMTKYEDDIEKHLV